MPTLQHTMRVLLGEAFGDSDWKMNNLVREMTSKMLDTLKRDFRTDADLDAVAAHDWNGVMRNVVVAAKKASAQASSFAKSGPSVPTSVGQWQIYSGDGAKEAAKELTAAAKGAATKLRAALKGVSDEKKAAKIIGKIYNAELYPVMGKWSKVGATDGEPRQVAQQFLIDVAKHVMGLPQGQWTNLGDEM